MDYWWLLFFSALTLAFSTISLVAIPGRKRDLSFLTNLPGAPEKLHILNADLSDPESFKPVIQGCIGVFHVAHPNFDEKEPEEVKAKRSVDSTLGIVKACLDSKTVRKFVYTSGASAVAFSGKDTGELNENDWSDVVHIRYSKMLLGSSNVISKTLTEKAVIEFAQTHGLDFVSVVPSFVNGPFICPHMPPSVYTSMAMIFGRKEQFMQLAKPQMVHVDDVCAAHIFLFEKTDAKGRYICSALEVTVEELSEFLSATYPEYPIPTPESLKEVEWIPNRRQVLSSKKLLDAGFEYKYGLEEMYDGAIQSCKDKGFL